MEQIISEDPKVIIKTDIFYSKEHIWIDNYNNSTNTFLLGLAQPKIIKRGPIIFLDFLFENQSEIKVNDVIAEIETSKSLTQIISPFNGTLVEFNNSLLHQSELLRKDPYNRGWLAKINIKDFQQGAFLNHSEYIEYIKIELGSRLGIK